MKYCLLFLLTIFSLSVVSSTEVDQTYFDDLRDLFDSGSLPDLEKISGLAWSGRCFLKNDPSLPVNSGLILRLKNLDVGPIGQKRKDYEASSYWSQGKEPSYYDKKTYDEVLASHNLKFTDVVVTDKDLIVGSSQIRFSNKYLVEKLIGNVDENHKEVVAYCYYFIPAL